MLFKLSPFAGKSPHPFYFWSVDFNFCAFISSIICLGCREYKIFKINLILDHKQQEVKEHSQQTESRW